MIDALMQHLAQPLCSTQHWAVYKPKQYDIKEHYFLQLSTWFYSQNAALNTENAGYKKFHILTNLP